MLLPGRLKLEAMKTGGIGRDEDVESMDSDLFFSLLSLFVFFARRLRISLVSFDHYYVICKEKMDSRYRSRP